MGFWIENQITSFSKKLNSKDHFFWPIKTPHISSCFWIEAELKDYPGLSGILSVAYLLVSKWEPAFCRHVCVHSSLGTMAFASFGISLWLWENEHSFGVNLGMVKFRCYLFLFGPGARVHCMHDSPKLPQRACWLVWWLGCKACSGHGVSPGLPAPALQLPWPTARGFSSAQQKS